MTIYMKCGKEPAEMITDKDTIISILISRDRLTFEDAMKKLKEKYNLCLSDEEKLITV